MASLDQMEGDAVELAVLALVVFIIIAVYLAWKGVNAGPLQWLELLLKWLEQEFANFLNWMKNLPAGSFGAKGNSAVGPSFSAKDVTQPVGSDAVYNYLPDWLGGSPNLDGSFGGLPGTSGPDPGPGTGVVSINGIPGSNQ